MKKLNWKKEYSIGVYEIDAEHKIFLKTIKKIYNAFEKNIDKDIVRRLLEELFKYADFHFTSEENVMLMNNYPDYESHKKEHNELTQTLANTLNFLDVDKINKKQLIDFLIQWFIEHTTSTDLELGKYLQKK